MGRISHKLSPFIVLDKGVDEYHSEAETDNRRLRGHGKTYNIYIDEKRIRKMPGAELFGPYLYDTCYGLYEYVDPDGTAHLLMAGRQTVYDVAETSLTALDTGLEEEELHFHTHRGRCYYNGTNTQRKITGSTASRVGIEAPETAASAVAAGTGLTGSYSWKYTFCIKESGAVIWESDPSSASSSVSLSNQGATVTIAVSADTRVNCRRIYRTSASGAIYKYEGEVDNNTGTTFTSGSVTDANLGSIVETNHGAPVQGVVSEGCNERMFWLDNSSSKARLRWSENAYTESYQEYQQTLSYRELPADGKGVWLKRMYNPNTQREDLYIGQESGIHVLPGGDPLSPIATLSRQVGGVQHDTVHEYRNRLVFMSNNNIVYMIYGGRLVDLTSRNIPDSMNELQSTEYCRAGVIFEHFYAISGRTPGTDKNNIVWVCDLRTIREVEDGRGDAVWFPWNKYFSYITQRQDGTVVAFDEEKRRLVKLSFENRQDEYGDGLFSEALKPVTISGIIAGASGSVSTQFDLYAASSGGATLWTETHTLSYASGAFSVDLGTNTEIPASIISGMAAGTKYYLEITIGGETLGRIELPKRAYFIGRASSASYTLALDCADEIEAQFATRFFGAQNPNSRQIAHFLYIKGKQQRKLTVTPEYKDYYFDSGTETTAERFASGEVLVEGGEPWGNPATQVSRMMECPLVPGGGGSVSFVFKKDVEDAYFEVEGIQYHYREFMRG